jgi:hypothetical protein
MDACNCRRFALAARRRERKNIEVSISWIRNLRQEKKCPRNPSAVASRSRREQERTREYIGMMNRSEE